MEHRINSPAHFKYALDALFFAVETFYFAINQKEQIHDGDTLSEPPEHDRFAFNLSTQDIGRPYELLQVLLDMVRVNFEPEPFGSLLLNANPCFLHDAVPSSSFDLGYLSVVSEQKENLWDFWIRSVAPYAKTLGYIFSNSSKLFVFCSTGVERYSLECFTELNEVIEHAYEEWELRKDKNGITFKKPDIERCGESMTGLCMDNNLEHKIRISLLIYL